MPLRDVSRAPAAEPRRLLRLFFAAFAVCFVGLSMVHRWSRGITDTPRDKEPQPASAGPSVHVVPWDLDPAWFERMADDRRPGAEPPSGLRLLSRLTERSIMNFVLDPRWSASGGFPAAGARDLEASPVRYRVAPVAVRGELVAADRRTAASLFGDAPDVPKGEMWMGTVRATDGEVRFLLDEPLDISRFLQKPIRVLGVFHRLAAPTQTTEVRPLVYAKTVVASPPVLNAEWPAAAPVPVIRDYLDTESVRAALLKSRTGLPPGGVEALDVRAALADPQSVVGRPRWLEGRVVWSSTEPFHDEKGLPYEFPDPSLPEDFQCHVSLVQSTDGQLAALVERASLKKREVGLQVSVKCVPVAPFVFRNRSWKGGESPTPATEDRDPEGTTRTLLIVGCP